MIAVAVTFLFIAVAVFAYWAGFADGCEAEALSCGCEACRDCHEGEIINETIR